MTKSAKWFVGILVVLAVVAIGFTALVLSLLSETGTGPELVTTGSGQKVAIVELRGVILNSEEVVRQLKHHRENKSVKAIVLRVESPGGGVVASQEIYEEMKKTRESGKPVVASMGSVAASGGYYVSCGASRIVANAGTLTGSIGVISEFLQLEEALAKLGVGIRTIKSGKLKDAGSLSRKMTTDDEKYFQGLMDDVHKQFINVVEKERKLSYSQAIALADGRVFTGRSAVEYGLVDTLGTFEEAVLIASALAGIDGEPAIVRERQRRSFMGRILDDAAESFFQGSGDVLHRPFLSYRFIVP